jgi:UDP-N-acetyl-D-mannosaminuronate dehydrogenase
VSTLAKETVLVVGLGEIGLPICELLRESGRFTVYGLDIDPKKMQEINRGEIPDKIDVMHVCIPCGRKEQLVEIVTGYVKQFKPDLVIINSTVPPGTTMALHKLCSCLVAHSPIRGVHKNQEHMKWELKRWTRYVGGADAKAGEAARRHFKKIGMKTKMLRSCTETELAKLFETTYRAWMIACFQEMHRIAKHFKADFDDAVDFLEDTHRVRLDRPVMFPGEIGGHCLIPNTKLLLESYDSEFLRLILKSNKKREREMENESVRTEAEKIRKRAEALEKKLVKEKR